MQGGISPDFNIPNASENCLFANIWRPVQASDAGAGDAGLLPVMFWIHGGGLTSGTGAQNWFNGTVFANKDVIVVTINYRLGPLGFLTLDDTLISEVEARSGEVPVGTGGTNGLNDQRTAMEWVRDNIEAFGGDPNQITVFGESAGGQSTCSHTVSPLARGLFHASIIQSGPCNGPWR